MIKKNSKTKQIECKMIHVFSRSFFFFLLGGGAWGIFAIYFFHHFSQSELYNFVTSFVYSFDTWNTPSYHSSNAVRKFNVQMSWFAPKMFKSLLIHRASESDSFCFGWKPHIPSKNLPQNSWKWDNNNNKSTENYATKFTGNFRLSGDSVSMTQKKCAIFSIISLWMKWVWLYNCTLQSVRMRNSYHFD